MSRQSERDNRANQLNPNNDAYWASRGLDERPEDWEDRSSTEKSPQENRGTVTKDSRKAK